VQPARHGLGLDVRVEAGCVFSVGKLSNRAGRSWHKHSSAVHSPWSICPQPTAVSAWGLWFVAPPSGGLREEPPEGGTTNNGPPFWLGAVDDRQRGGGFEDGFRQAGAEQVGEPTLAVEQVGQRDLVQGAPHPVFQGLPQGPQGAAAAV